MISALQYCLELPWELLSEFGIERRVETAYLPGQTIVMYPPYEALSPDFDESTVLSGRPAAEYGSVNLYMHIPFCSGICTYCSYARSARGQADTMRTYVSALRRQRDVWLERLGIPASAVESVFLGGGTPTSLSRQDLVALVESTPRSPNAEFSVETDPDMATRSDGAAKLAALRQAGCNRISMGVETFDDDLAKAIGRRGHHQVNEAIAAIRKAGFDSINIDLMYGLPNQSLNSWLETLEMAVETGVSSITLYCFKLKPGSIDWKRWRAGTGMPHYRRHVVVMQRMAETFLKEHGYAVVNGKWFVKGTSGFLQQTRKYQNSTLLGLGPSTYSFIADHQFIAQDSTARYMDAMAEGKPVIERGLRLSAEELTYRRFVFGLKSGVNVLGAVAQAPSFPQARILVLMEELISAGLISMENGHAVLSEMGRLFADEICRLFYSPVMDARIGDLNQRAA